MNWLITTPALNVFEQMALDETLVHTYTGGAFLRLYRWTSGPAVTFGYAQAVREVRAQAAPHSGPLCRRPTGGGMVFHTDDLTFSLLFQSAARPSVIYQQLHSHIRAALTLSGVSSCLFNQKLPASAYAPSRQHTANACFVNPVENDLLTSTGAKMLGGAIRRFGTTVLYQGSVQLPGARHNPQLTQALINGVRGFLAADLRVQALSPDVLSRARTLAHTQYQTHTWTEKF